MNNISTTHVGSLPRSQSMADAIFAKENVVITGQNGTQQRMVYDDSTFEQIATKAVDEVVAKQKQVGIDLPSDGEMSKLSYATYIKDRLHGFEGDSPRRTPADLEDFMGYAKAVASSGGIPTYKRPQCVDKITIKDFKPLHDDIKRFQEALQRHGYTKGFMNAASPGVIAQFQPSVYHKSYEDYLQNLAEVMREEYKIIIQSGLDLQIDAPDLALGRHVSFKDKSDEEFIKIAQLHIEVLNYALEGLDPQKLRMHICWGNYEGPHHKDIALEKILSTVFTAKPRLLLFEASNPRHAHEYEAFKQVTVPDDMILIPGAIDSLTNFIDHPRLVAQRLERFADIVGFDRVIGGTDCGFATFAGFGKVHSDIVWEKLKALVQGAKIASQKTQ